MKAIIALLCLTIAAISVALWDPTEEPRKTSPIQASERESDEALNVSAESPNITDTAERVRTEAQGDPEPENAGSNSPPDTDELEALRQENQRLTKEVRDLRALLAKALSDPSIAPSMPLDERYRIEARIRNQEPSEPVLEFLSELSITAQSENRTTDLVGVNFEHMRMLESAFAEHAPIVDSAVRTWKKEAMKTQPANSTFRPQAERDADDAATLAQRNMDLSIRKCLPPTVWDMIDQ